MSKSNPSVCNDNNKSVRTPAGLGVCLDREIEALNRQIDFLDTRLNQEQVQTGQSLSAQLERAIFFAERMRLMWANYLLSFLGTLAFASLMLAGLILRDALQLQPLRAYEFVRHRSQRAALRDYHVMNQAAVNRVADPLRFGEQMPRFNHWSSDKEFFSEAYSNQALDEFNDTSIDQLAAESMWVWLQSLNTRLGTA